MLLGCCRWSISLSSEGRKRARRCPAPFAATEVGSGWKKFHPRRPRPRGCHTRTGLPPVTDVLACALPTKSPWQTASSRTRRTANAPSSKRTANSRRPKPSSGPELTSAAKAFRRSPNSSIETASKQVPQTGVSHLWHFSACGICGISSCPLQYRRNPSAMPPAYSW
jgi:hypothetical protein